MKFSEKRVSGRFVFQFFGAILIFAIGLVLFMALLAFVGAVFASMVGDAVAATIVIGTIGFFFCLVSVGYWKSRKHSRLLREKYQYVYRVLAPPPGSGAGYKAPLAEILIGDHGWEAPPLVDDGLVYLQGLTSKWGVVWYAGFHPDQIEKVGLKPQSQYDWNYTWLNNPPVCPHPIVERQTQDLGLPR